VSHSQHLRTIGLPLNPGESGNALCEELKYDAEGQLLTGSLMDSLVPTALEMPAWRIAHPEPLLLSPLAA
jgi:aerobic carbon-monoxide dehydrogenase large subunit